MIALIQRVGFARLSIENQLYSAIGPGMLLLLGISVTDEEKQAAWLAKKVAGLRIFSDPDGKMNLSLADVQGAVLLVSQFTLVGDCRKGRRPSFVEAARPEKARVLYEKLADNLRQLGLTVETGTFQAHMEVRLLNDGPVTLLLDSRKLF